jgi:hypothetical protein
MTPSEAVAAKLGALQLIAEDASLSSCDVRLSVLLLTQYFNTDHGYAWPSRKRLSEQLNVALSTITRALVRLESRGHFTVERDPGRGHTNRYYPAFIKDASALPFTETNGRVDAIKGEHTRTEMDAPMRPDSFYEPVKTPIKTTTNHNEDVTNDRTRGTRINTNWRPDAECREFAINFGLNPDQILPEFIDYWLAAPNGVKRDWNATWRNRCRYEAKRATERRSNGSRRGGIVAGTLEEIDSIESKIRCQL